MAQKALLTLRGFRGSLQNPLVITLKVPKEYLDEGGSPKLEALPEGVAIVAFSQSEYLMIDGLQPSDYGFEVEITSGMLLHSAKELGMKGA